MSIVTIVWLVKVFGNILAKYLIAWPLTPIIVLFVKRDGELPNWLYWFTTPDNPKLEEYGWIHESRPFLNESNRFKRYVNRCFWLWRNSLYGFNESVIGVELGIGREKLITVGDSTVGNLTGVQGIVKRKLYRNGTLIAWQWYWIKQLPFWKRKCIRVNLGYKLWSYGNPKYPVAHAVLSPWINKFNDS